MKKFVQYFAEKSLIVNILTLGIFIAGMFALFSSNREAFPKVEYDWVTVMTVYPGSTARDVEKHITIPLENEIRGVDGIEEIFSSSIESRSVISIKLDPDGGDKDKVINDLKDAVETSNDLPDDAEKPIVTELSSSLVPVLEISIIRKKGVHNDSEERDLRAKADQVEDGILELSGVSRLDKMGYREREMTIEVDPVKLERYHLSIGDVINALKGKNLNYPGGVAKTDKEETMIRTIGEVSGKEDIEKVLVNANDLGNWVYVGDVANVRDTFEELTRISKTMGERSIVLTVLKKESADIINLVDDVTELCKKYESKFGEEYDIVLSNDISYYVKRRLNVLLNNGIVGFTLVLISLFLALGWRIALVTSVGLPVAFCITFIWMGYAGVSVNLMTMFGLIIVLGMLVDDAIVVSENIYRHIEEGLPIKEAVVQGTAEVILPVAGTILTTIAAFSPLMFMTGIMGKFIWALPAVVSVSLVASWFESMFILPSHIYEIEKRSKKLKVGEKKAEGGAVHEFFKSFYGKSLSFVLRNKYKSLLFATVFFIGTLVLAKTGMKMVLFPKDKIERFIIKMEAPMGTSMTKMEKKVKIFENLVSQIPEKELDNYLSVVGVSRSQTSDPNQKMGSNYASMIVNLTPEENRYRNATEIIDDLRKKAAPFWKEFKSLEIRTVRAGPPMGSAVKVAIKGNDFKELKAVSGEIKDYLHGIKGLKDIKDNFEEGKREIRVIVDEKIAAIAGVKVIDVASTLRSYFEGTVATKIKRSDEEIDIRVKFPDNLRNNLKSLSFVKVPNRRGNLIPLGRIAKFVEGRGISVIHRQSWKRSIIVSADIDENEKGLSSVSVNKMLQRKFADIDEKYPGVILDYLGEFKDTKDSMVNLARSLVIAVLVIYLILVALFGSLLQPLVIVSVIPMTIVGVIWAFYFHGMPFSFLGLLGIVGLTGVVVNDSIVLVDFIRRNRAFKMGTLEASVDAGVKRLRPVYLTTVTTFFGLIPTAYGLGGFDPFLKPMAVAMSWGLLFGTFITLFGTPLIYNILSDMRKFVMRREDSSSKLRGSEMEGGETSEQSDEIKKLVRSEIKRYLKNNEDYEK